MTKICPKCSSENPDIAGFCQNCGEDLKNVSSEKVKSKSISTNWWDKRGTKSKAAIGITGVCCIGIILLMIIGAMLPDNNSTYSNSGSTDSDTQNTSTTPTTTSNSPTPNFSVGNSKFYLSGGFEEGWSSSGGVGVSRIRLDKTDTNVIVTEYTDKSLYESESKNAVTYKTIDNITIKKIPNTFTTFFEKNNKYYGVAVMDVSTDGTQTASTESSENLQYLEDIIGSMQNA